LKNDKKDQSQRGVGELFILSDKTIFFMRFWSNEKS